jgi:Mn2+/Fe2+ NRAMP family transporter
VKLHSPYFDSKTSVFNDDLVLEPGQTKKQLDDWISDAPTPRIESINKAIKYSTIDTTLNLCIAFFINAAILIVAAANFNTRSLFDVADIQVCFKLLKR